jgi:hypothetical protein
MSSEAEKRALSSSSDQEQSQEKRPKINEEVPEWARTLLSEVAHCKNNTNAIMLTVNDLKNELRGVKADVEGLGDRLTNLEMKQEASDKRLVAAENEIEDLKDENKRLHGRIDTLTDNSMRDTLTVHHIPRQGKESWDDTETILAEFLAKNTTQSVNDWLGKITRAHRGKPTSNVIHVLFRNWKWAQEVRELFRVKQGKIGSVFCLDKYSIKTQDRRNLAQDKRDKYRRDFPGTKLWIKYPAILMAKHVGDEKYSAIFTY